MWTDNIRGHGRRRGASVRFIGMRVPGWAALVLCTLDAAMLFPLLFAISLRSLLVHLGGLGLQLVLVLCFGHVFGMH